MKSNLSLKKIAANRRNARRSTGPRTPAGKNKVKWNALRHGLLSRELLFPGGESRRRRQEYALLLAGLRRDLAPRGRLEEMLVESIAVCYWRLGRALRCEGGEIRKAREQERTRRRPGYAPADAIREIFGIKKDRSHEQERLEREAQERAHHEKQRRDGHPASLSLPQEAALRRLGRYEAGIQRQLYRTIRELRRAQAERRGPGRLGGPPKLPNKAK